MWKAAVKQVTFRPLVLIGAGNLGYALCSNYNEFEHKGLKIVAAFDNDPQKCGREFGNVPKVEHINNIQRVIKDVGAQVAILAIPGREAQEITKLCVDAGISTILNYTPARLNVPHHVHVEYMDPATKIAMALNGGGVLGSAAPFQLKQHPSGGANGQLFFPILPHMGPNPTPLLTSLARYKFGLSPPNTATSMQQPMTREDCAHMQHIRPGLSLSSYFSQNCSRYNVEFEETGVLGKGGYGSVFRARHRIDGMEYAVKKIHITIHPQDTFDIVNHKYLREVRAMARLEHPNIVRYYHAWMEMLTVIDADDIDLPIADANINNNMTIPSVPSSTSTPLSNSETTYSYPSTNSSKDADAHDDAISASSASECQPSCMDVLLYIQMECCKGITLKKWLGLPDRSVDLIVCHTILKDVLMGLAHIHRAGYIHRDVTPSNLFVYIDTLQSPPHIVVKIGDFGLAKYQSSCKNNYGAYCNNNDNNNNGNLTVVNTLSSPGGEDDYEQTVGVGTYLYASPEQLSCTVYDSCADMYSVGVVFFELLHPFHTQMERVLTLTQLKKGHIPAQISILYPRQCEIIQQLLMDDPARRPSAEDVLPRVHELGVFNF